MSGSRFAAPLTPFTVDASAALPLAVCSQDGVRASLGLSASLKGSSVVRSTFPSLAPRGRAGAAATPRTSASKLLDGFSLLEAAAVELPEDATSAVLDSRGFSDDLGYFVNIRTLNLGDNKLGAFGSFDLLSCLGSCLPNLVELRLHCNSITGINSIRRLPTSVGVGADEEAAMATLPVLQKLEVLDLSYNNVPPEAIANLAALPSLSELDLSSNGLEELPDMRGFGRLQVLVLQRNQLTEDDVLVKLSLCPKLRELNLGNNYLARIPKGCVAGRMHFPYLEWLDLSNNYFSSEDDLLFLVKITTLQQAVLFGNPVTYKAKKAGRQAGEAPPPALAASEGTAETALVTLDAAHAQGKVVNLVTDDPAKDGKKRRPQGTYSNFRVTKVVEKQLPSNAEWRAAGNKFLFDDESDEEPSEGEAEPESASEPEDEYGFDGVPQTFITAGSGVPPEEKADPVQLRAALTSLRHLLKHPLTDDHDDNVEDKAYLKTTASMKSRKVPLRPYVKKHEKATVAGARHAPVALASSAVRGPPGSTHTEVHQMAGSAVRRPAGASAVAVGGRVKSTAPVSNPTRVDKVLQATEEAQASVDAMEAMLERMTMAGTTQVRPPTRDVEQTMGGFLAQMDATLKSTYM